MKAINYYDDYRRFLSNMNLALSKEAEIAKEIVIKMCDEAVELALTRHVKTDDGFMAILKEVNQKWNALIRVCEKKEGFSYLRKDGFLLLVEDLVPACKRLLDIAGEAPPMVIIPEKKPDEPGVLLIRKDPSDSKQLRGQLAAFAMVGTLAMGLPTHYDS